MLVKQVREVSKQKAPKSYLPAWCKDLQSLIRSFFPEIRVVRHFLGPDFAVFDLFGEDVAGNERPGFQQVIAMQLT